jgi:CTP synthase
MVIEELDVKNSIYEVPVELAKQELDLKILKLLELPARNLDLSDWNRMLETAIHPKNGTVEIAVVGKYTSLRDAYKSIYEALSHGGIANDLKVKIHPVEAEELEHNDPAKILKDFDGILVPGGFGDRGVAGKIKAVEYARKHNVPFLGICLGMQCAVIEFARHVCGMSSANSTEFSPRNAYPVIALMEGQKTITDLGGTMRLGAYPCILKKGTKAFAAYDSRKISERHRHRYEFNSEFRKQLEAKGLKVAGTSPDGELVEVIELDSHPWFVACQFHPEFKSTPLAAHPLFRDFVKAALANRG